MSRELLDEMDALLAMRNRPQYKNLGEFFEGAESLLSPMTGIPELRDFLATSLFPMAPYLQSA